MIEDILKPGELEAIGQRLIKVREHLGLKQNRLAADVDYIAHAGVPGQYGGYPPPITA